MLVVTLFKSPKPADRSAVAGGTGAPGGSKGGPTDTGPLRGLGPQRGTGGMTPRARSPGADTKSEMSDGASDMSGASSPWMAKITSSGAFAYPPENGTWSKGEAYTDRLLGKQQGLDSEKSRTTACIRHIVLHDEREGKIEIARDLDLATKAQMRKQRKEDEASKRDVQKAVQKVPNYLIELARYVAMDEQKVQVTECDQLQTKIEPVQKVSSKTKTKRGTSDIKTEDMDIGGDAVEGQQAAKLKRTATGKETTKVEAEASGTVTGSPGAGSALTENEVVVTLEDYIKTEEEAKVFFEICDVRNSDSVTIFLCFTDMYERDRFVRASKKFGRNEGSLKVPRSGGAPAVYQSQMYDPYKDLRCRPERTQSFRMIHDIMFKLQMWMESHTTGPGSRDFCQMFHDDRHHYIRVKGSVLPVKVWVKGGEVQMDPEFFDWYMGSASRNCLYPEKGKWNKVLTKSYGRLTWREIEEKMYTEYFLNICVKSEVGFHDAIGYVDINAKGQRLSMSQVKQKAGIS